MDEDFRIVEPTVGQASEMSKTCTTFHDPPRSVERTRCATASMVGRSARRAAMYPRPSVDIPIISGDS